MSFTRAILGFLAASLTSTQLVAQIVDIGNYANRIHPSPSGARLIVESFGTGLVSIDLRSLTVTGRYPEKSGHRTMVVTPRRVFVSEGNFVRALHSKTLEVQRSFDCGRRVKFVQPLPPDRILIEIETPRVAKIVDSVSLEVLSELRMPNIPSGFPEYQTVGSSVERLGEGRTRFGDMVFDASWNPCLLAGKYYFPLLVERDLPKGVRPIARWSAQKLPLSKKSTATLTHVPVRATATVRSNGPKVAEVKLEYSDLASEEILASQELTDVAFDREENSRDNSGIYAPLAVTPQIVAVGVGKSVGVFAIPYDKLQGAKAPLRFLPTQSKIIVPSDAVAEVQFQATGGRGRLEYRLPQPVADIDIDSETGLVTVDVPRLLKAFWVAPRARHLKYRDPIANFPPTFRWLTGEPLAEDHEPLTIPLILAVADDNDQQAWLHANLLTTVPRETFVESIVARARRNPAPDETPPTLLTDEETRERVAAIQERIARLDAQLLQILRRLESIERRVKTRRDSGG